MTKQNLSHFLTDAFSGSRTITVEDLHDLTASVYGSIYVTSITNSQELIGNQYLIKTDFTEVGNFVALPPTDEVDTHGVVYQGKNYKIYNPTEFEFNLKTSVNAVGDSISLSGVDTDSITISSFSTIDLVCIGSKWVIITNSNLDGVKYVIMSTATRATTTWASAGAAIVGAPATLTANTPVCLQYSHANATWYISL